MADTQEVRELKRRARRRLVGAIALVLFLVIVPPMIMDLEPKPVTSDLNVEIPAQSRGEVKAPPPAKVEEAARATAAAPAAEPSAKADAGAEGAPKSEAAKAEADKAAKAKRPATAPLAAVTKAKEAERAEAILKGEAFVVPLGAYSNPENVKQLQAKLARAGVKSYTEPVTGGSSAQTRVAAGPFTTREEAEQTRQKLAALKGLGVVPGTVTTRQ